jgi:hypothetical protein
MPNLENLFTENRNNAVLRALWRASAGWYSTVINNAGLCSDLVSVGTSYLCDVLQDYEECDGLDGTALGTDCTTVGSSSPLHVAAEHGHITTVAALLAAGANVNLRDTVRTQNPPPALALAACVSRRHPPS